MLGLKDLIQKQTKYGRNINNMRLNYDGTFTRATVGGIQYVSKTKPTLSFTFDVLVYDEERQYRVDAGVTKRLTMEQGAEVQRFCSNITENTTETANVQAKFDAYKLIGETTQDVLRYQGQVALGVSTTLTSAQYNQLLLDRENAFTTLGA